MQSNFKILTGSVRKLISLLLALLADATAGAINGAAIANRIGSTVFDSLIANSLDVRGISPSDRVDPLTNEVIEVRWCGILKDLNPCVTEIKTAAQRNAIQVIIVETYEMRLIELCATQIENVMTHVLTLCCCATDC
jgi:hypothetical protein